MKTDITVALIGNPNSGKTTLFNALTGAHQKVGNWPGVTVERKSGYFFLEEKIIEVVDLPGVYTLSHSFQTPIDESITREYILSNTADVFINVIDASHLERHLYLTAQLIEMQVPMILAVNMVDMLEKEGKVLNVAYLAERLGCPVISLVAHKHAGVEVLKEQLAAVETGCQQWIPHDFPSYPSDIESALHNAEASLSGMQHVRYHAIRRIEEQGREEHWEEEPDILIASARYTWAHETTNACVASVRASHRHQVTTVLDRWVLSRFFGIPLFLFVIYFMFLFSIHIGGIFQDFFDQVSDLLFVQGTVHLLQAMSIPSWLTAIVGAGIGRGLNTTISFIPVLAAMFFCLSFLEASGYMARAAFVMDRFMQVLGLPGKALVPMIVGFGCNVPAIMGARTLSDPRERILTIMMSPFMSCSARLAVFSVFVAAFFPSGGENIVFMLYVIGMGMAILTGVALRKTVLRGESSLWLMELPDYHWPSWKALLFPTFFRTKNFLFRAGKIIVPVCILLGTLNSLTMEGQFSLESANENSLLSLLGRTVTPIFAPMGIVSENWPATVGLMTGALAKEVVVATLNTLYMQVGHLADSTTSSIPTTFAFWEALKAAALTIPEHIRTLPEALSHPLLASVSHNEVTTGVYGEMYTRFSGAVGAFAYLLFVLLYIPCASTMAVIKKELSRGWMLFSIGWSTALAYSLAVLYYQIMTWSAHPSASFCWLLGISLFYVSVIQGMRKKNVA